MHSVSRCKPLLGTYVEISLSGDFSEMELHQLCSGAFAEIERIQNFMSFHEENSELTKINKLPVQRSLTLSADMLEVLTFAQSLHAASSRAFDIGASNCLIQHKALPQHSFLNSSVLGSSANLELNFESKSVIKTSPVTLDLGGIAKGYAVDKAFDYLSQQTSLSHITVNAGGDLRVFPHQHQEISLRPPDELDHTAKVSVMLDQACATSASTFAGDNLTSFIVAPKSDQCISDSRSITVFAPCCMSADALTKVCFLEDDPIALGEILQLYNASHLEFN